MFPNKINLSFSYFISRLDPINSPVSIQTRSENNFILKKKKLCHFSARIAYAHINSMLSRTLSV